MAVLVFHSKPFDENDCRTSASNKKPSLRTLINIPVDYKERLSIKIPDKAPDVPKKP